MECPNCHKQVDEDSTFCKYCGRPLQQKLPSPTDPSGIGWKSGIAAFVLLLIIFVLFLLFMKPVTS